MSIHLIETKPQVIRETIVDRALEDAGIEAIFANCQESEYLEQIIMLCMSRKHDLVEAEDKIEQLERRTKDMYSVYEYFHGLRGESHAVFPQKK